MLVIDDYLDWTVFSSIKASLQAPTFPWQKTQIISSSAAVDLAPHENVQLVHGFYLKKRGIFFQSPNLETIRPLLDKLAPRSLIKVKANRTVKRDRHVEYGLHVDTRRPGATTAIFYLNTNDGYTRFGTGEKVMSVENRLVLFDASNLHTGASCTDAEERMVLNLNMMMGPPAE